MDGIKPRQPSTWDLQPRQGRRSVARGEAPRTRLLLLTALALIAIKPAQADEPYPIQRTVRYSLTVRNTTAEPVEGAEVRVYAPVKETATQQTIGLDISQPFEVLEDDLGNQVVCLQFDLPAYGVRAVSVEARVAFATSPTPVRLAGVEQLTGPAPFIEVDHPLIHEAATKLGGTSPEDIARRAYEWVADHVIESGYVAEDLGALSTLKVGKGDCTESMYLFIALVRARGIPARGVEGFVIRGDAVLRAQEFHNWAEYYAGETWHLADPQRRVLGPAEEQYLAMRIIESPAAGPAATTRRFEALHPALEVRLE